MDKMTSESRANCSRKQGSTVRGICVPLRGFTLIELLTVLVILSILTTLIVPAVTTISRGSNLNLGGQIIADHFTFARQEAVSKNRDIELRFYQLTNGLSTGWRAVQLMRIEQTPKGPEAIASTRIAVIPEGIVMASNDLSPLISESPREGTVTLPAYGLTSYRAFRFRANGSLETSVGNNNYVTLFTATDSANPPANYYTIQINSLTGKVSVFRP